jgi:hypothetical protein
MQMDISASSDGGEVALGDFAKFVLNLGRHGTSSL